MSLLVKRGCDEVFQPLGEMMKIWGRVPFTPGPAPPPLQVRASAKWIDKFSSIMDLVLPVFDHGSWSVRGWT